jgi:polysaccharide biosynthesis/export protein
MKTMMKKRTFLIFAVSFFAGAVLAVAQQTTPNSPPAHGTPSQGKLAQDSTQGAAQSAATASRDTSPTPAAAVKSPATTALGKKTDPDPGFVIGAQDVLVIDVWQEKELSAKAEVRPDGKITLPLINDIQAAGLKPSELKDSIQKALAKYVTDPQVTVMVEQINSRVVFMTGEVNRPGALPLVRPMTVLQALTLVGGPNQFANARKIYVMRTVNGKSVKFPFDYKKTLKVGPGKDNIILQPGDTVVVP